MRHRVVGKTLGRDAAHRKALLRNLSDSLVLYESITTTLAKAKYVQPYIEELITKVRGSSEHNFVKYAKRKLSTQEAVRKLLTEIAPRFVNRPGGYTRIVRVGNRAGDNTMMARIEFVENAAKKTKAAPKKEVKKEVKDEK